MNVFVGSSVPKSVGPGVRPVAALGLLGWVWLEILLGGPTPGPWGAAGDAKACDVILDVGCTCFARSQTGFPFGLGILPLALALPHPAGVGQPGGPAGGWLPVSWVPGLRLPRGLA